MTIQSTDRKAGPFLSGTLLPFDFKVFTKEDIQVIYTSAAGVETVLVLDSEYSVSLNVDQDNSPGGTVTLNTAITGGDNAVIIGDLEYDQGTDIRNQSGFEPEIVEDALDRVTILVQQLLEMAKRTLRIPASSNSIINTQLPQPTANNVLGWNNEADQLINLSPQDIATTVAFGTAFVDQFEGDGIETEFTLSANPALLANMDVQVDGVSLRNGIDFMLLPGAVIKFTNAPAAPSVPGELNIQVRGTVAVPQGFDTADVVVTQLPASGLWTTVQGFINSIVSSAGASIIGFMQAGAGAVIRNIQGKLRERVSILDFIPVSEHAAIRAGTSSFDCRPALYAAINSYRSPGPGFTVSGPWIEFPGGDYKLGGFIDLKIKVRISGTIAGMPDGQPVKLIFPANSEGFIVNTYNTINGGVETIPTVGADGSIIENVVLQGGGGTNVNAHGIWLRARAIINNVTVRDFRGNGVHAAASAGGGGEFEGNCNNFRVDTMRIIQCGGHGLFVNGGDANAGTIIGVDATSNQGWGIWDSSFLGNTYIGCHVDNNTLGSYRSDDPNARNVFVGCYSESGHPPSDIKAPAMVIGGLHGAGFTSGSSDARLYETSLSGADIGTSTRRRFGKFTQVDLTGNVGIGTENPGEMALYGTNKLFDMRGPSNDVAGYYIQRTLNNSVESRMFTEGGVSPRFAMGSVTANRLELFTSGLTRFSIDSTPGHLTPGLDNAQNLGSASLRMATIFAGTGAINTSDAREKQQDRPLSEKERAVAIKAKSLLKSFKFTSAVDLKGEGARIHFGIYAQELKAAFESEGLVVEHYAVLCYDEWEELPEIYADVVDEKGDPTGERKLVQEYRAAGNRYGVRYDELFAFILAAL